VTVDRSTQAWVRRLIDPASWNAWHEVQPGHATCGCTADNEIRCGRARIDGVHAAVITIGSASGVATLTAHVTAQLAATFERARAERLPVVAVASSGGVRLQEGTRTFVAMAAVAAAVTAHRDAGLLFLCYYTNPTTGGALVSWAGHAAVRAAEPDALVAFSGPRVAELAGGESDAAQARKAESLLDAGVIDAVVPPGSLRHFVSAVLHGTVGGDRPQRVHRPEPAPPGPVDAWPAILRTRDHDRPGLRELLAHLDEPVQLRGDGYGGGDDPTVIASVGRLRGRRVLVVGHDRAAGPDRASVTVAGMRKAARALELATRLELPMVSVIDTPGVRPGPAAEADGIGFHLAAALADRARSRATLVSVLLGEGAGGAALALLPAQYTIAAASAWLAPLSPEGSSAVLFHTVERAPEIAAKQHLTSADLVSMGVVDLVIAEDGDWIARIVDAVAVAIAPD